LVVTPDGIVPQSLDAEYDVIACSLGATLDLCVGAIFAFPRDALRPFACGFSARPALDAALVDAARECLQSLSFLWGETLPIAPPPVSAEPAYHQDFYLLPAHHWMVREWLGNLRRSAKPPPSVGGSKGYQYVDLTPEHLRRCMRVAKALPHGELPLTFGIGHPSLMNRLPPELAVHPVA
jgi:hypothetical protein